MLRQQMPGVDPDTMMKGLEWLSSIANYYAKTRNFFGNKFIQLAIILTLIAAVFYFFGRWKDMKCSKLDKYFMILFKLL